MQRRGWRWLKSTCLTLFGVDLGITGCAEAHIASQWRMHYTSHVEYPFPPVGIVGAADGKNRRAFFFLCSPNHKGTKTQLINNLCVLVPLWLS